jgi:hypothetical protein
MKLTVYIEYFDVEAYKNGKEVNVYTSAGRNSRFILTIDLAKTEIIKLNHTYQYLVIRRNISL